jgi:squalene cyclase
MAAHRSPLAPREEFVSRSETTTVSHHPAIERGIQYLLDTQRPDGSWDEPEFTGTGFPRVFYLRYDYYRIYFPLLALTQFKVQSSRFNVETGSLQTLSLEL